jgi:hypothetical protein
MTSLVEDPLLSCSPLVVVSEKARWMQLSRRMRNKNCGTTMIAFCREFFNLAGILFPS